MISVVIPLYNKEKSIGNTIRCVLAQTFQDFEIVVVDDGSTDESTEIVKQFTDERICLIHQENAGVSAARNKGITEAKGEYIAFLDADDEWLPNHLEELNNLMVEYPQCRAWATSYVNNIAGVNHNIILNKIPFKGQHGLLVNYFEIASYSHPPVWSSAVCVKKELLLHIGGFPVGVKSGEDLLTWAKIAIITNWAYSMNVTSKFMLGNESIAKSRRTHDRYDFVGDEFVKLYNMNRCVRGLRKYVALWYKMRAMCGLQECERVYVVREAVKSIKYNPWNLKLYIYMGLSLCPYYIIKKILEKFVR